MNQKIGKKLEKRGQPKKKRPRVRLKRNRLADSLTCLELARDLAGCLEGPEDLSVNPKYLEGLGE
jgi:hypothetical protein